MRVLLVNPAFDGRAEVPPLGILCLAAVLIENGFDSRVVDLDTSGSKETADDPCRKLCAEINGFDPIVLGVTATSRNYDSALQAISCAKEFSPGLVCVLGGVHATVACRCILETVPEIDFLIRGEDEISFLQLVRRLAEKRNCESVDGLSFSSPGGTVQIGGAGPPTSIICRCRRMV